MCGMIRWGMSNKLFERVFVPLADPDDAAETARALDQFVHDDSQIIIVHVIEKAGGAPDKAGVVQRQEFAEEAYTNFLNAFTLRDEQTINPLTLYGRNVAETIIEGAADTDATVITFSPRKGSRWIKFLTGNTTQNLVENSTIPVLTLPADGTGSETKAEKEP